MQNRFNYRYIARLIIEAQTPLFVGSGDASLLKDALVQKDHNGFPMIPGTAVTGVLRHSLEVIDNDKEKWNDVFGFQNGNAGLGSRLKVSSAYFLLGNHRIAEGLEVEFESELRNRFENLPSRQHVRINEKGVAIDKGLFDNEVVYKGARFLFEIELEGTNSDTPIWTQIINEFKSPLFRIGQGTRNGYGNLRVIEIYNRIFELDKESDFDEYLNYDPSFNSGIQFEDVEQVNANGILTYKLCLKPDDFFIFNEGFGDAETDNKPLTEEIIRYKNGQISFDEKRTVIPASSIKGAVAHRVCFHYNKLKEKFADELSEPEIKNSVGSKNNAVSKLFGNKGAKDKKTKKNTGCRGLLIMDDLYYDDVDNTKMLNHVAIDRFTGGAIDGALFSEKVSYKRDEKVEFEIFLTENDIEQDILDALEESLKDICKGLLPLGGMTTKGHGMFTGTLHKNGNILFSYNENPELCNP